MAAMSLGEEDIGEPELNYWKPVPKPPPVTPIAPTYMNRNSPSQCGLPYPQQLHPTLNNHAPLLSLPMYHQPIPHHSSLAYSQTPGFCYPPNDVVHSYIQNQQVGLTMAVCESERRRVAHCPQVSAEGLLSSLSTSSLQNSQMMTDSLIHEEVTRAAKTLFSKRNRTLLHWLNPDVSKNQLKIDVNAAWDSLPTPEKLFYISQVLGKFAPHTTSLMVNPQLEPSKKESMCILIKNEKSDNDDRSNTSNDSGSPLDIIKVKRNNLEPNVKKPRGKAKQERKPPKRRMEYSSDDEASCDSGLVVDIESAKEPSNVGPKAEQPRVKRKYTKRKQKDQIKLENSEGDSSTNSCSLPVKISDIKKEPNTDFNTVTDHTVPRVKRKYIKRKLVRKKYKKREPKSKLCNEILMEPMSSCNKQPEELKNTCEDMDIWIELENDTELTKGIEDFKLLSEEVDSFWDNIEDPNNLFLELEIE